MLVLGTSFLAEGGGPVEKGLLPPRSHPQNVFFIQGTPRASPGRGRGKTSGRGFRGRALVPLCACAARVFNT
ncbi:hypothetical protein DWUX_483 [Desulfovibrio diazotrophicus]|nr:hypothetical protein DWUX_483 [Desulfovibrio diazotrophicus]